MMVIQLELFTTSQYHYIGMMNDGDSVRATLFTTSQYHYTIDLYPLIMMYSRVKVCTKWRKYMETCMFCAYTRGGWNVN